jgi:ribosomal protein S18 acetylase RimI-like enzyme
MGGMDMDLSVQLLPRKRVREAVAVLTKAFAEDPIFNHYFPDGDERSRVFRLFFTDLIRTNLRLGHVYCALAGQRMIGAAVWHPPGAPGPSIKDRVRSAITGWRVARISKQAAEDLFAGFAELETLHPERPHWHLLFIGVDKAARTKHVGSDLLKPVLSLADKRGQLCYLETPFPETHQFYRRSGFQITGTSHPFRGAPTIWIMSREPANSC